MRAPKEHINKICISISDWLHPDNKNLQLAIERTVDEELFSFEDIKHQILALKNAIKPAKINQWVSQSNSTPNSLRNRSVLCLHAGNLPLVGFQDFLAIMISGANYMGKLSKKDPYLLESLIRVFMENNVVSNIQYNSDLDALPNVEPDAWLFSGSQENASAVENLLIARNMLTRNTPSLIRTAFYSVAFIDKLDEVTLDHLTEAVFRYGGSGCRSVAMVVSPFGLDSIKCRFTDHVENFWLKNPQHKKPEKALKHRFAMNKAIGVNQAWLNDFLIEEGEKIPQQKFILKWKKGNLSTIDEIIKSNIHGIQSVYSTAVHLGKSIGNSVIEPLSTAQNPPIWWKPDGIDTLRWVYQNISCED